MIVEDSELEGAIDCVVDSVLAGDTDIVGLGLIEVEGGAIIS